MGKFGRSLLIGVGLISVGVAVIIPSCKTRNPAQNQDSSLSASNEKKKIAEDIKSFNDTQQKLIAANQRGASACEKLDILWGKIEETKQAENGLMPPNSVIKEVLTFGNGSVHRFWRIFQGWSAAEGGAEIRPYENGTTDAIRLTHRYGVLAKMKFVVNKDVVKKLGYTGHYAEGNDCVLGRLSSAVPTSVGNRFTPAVATKFFVGGDSESQVLIAQHDIGGQSSGTDFTVTPSKEKVIDNNFYTHNLSNRLSFEKGVLSGVGAFSRFLYTAQYYSKNVLNLDYVFDPRELQANHLAERDASGARIVTPKGPRFVWMVAPSVAVRAEFGQMAKNDSDFRKHFLSLNSRMKDGNPLTVFNIYASDTWTYNPEADANLIGQLVTNSEFVVSEAADVRLFFKHAIQFHRIPETEGKPNPYTQDYAFAEWGDPLFTGDCRFGVKEVEVIPTKADGLDGKFLRDSIINPKTVRLDKNGKPCVINIVEDKLEETLAPYLNRL